MYIVLDVEFYHNKKKQQLGPIKQIGAFKFDEQYQILDVFEMTVTKYTPNNIINMLFTDFLQDVEEIYLWAKTNDFKALDIALDIDFSQFSIIDVQTYFKGLNLASLSSISEALNFDKEGRHNALIDAEYTFEVIKYFNLNNKISRTTIENFINLYTKKNKVSHREDNHNQIDGASAKANTLNANYKLIKPGFMRKLNDKYYQIISINCLNYVIDSIIKRKLPIIKDGNFKLDDQLEQLVKEEASIVISNTDKFHKLANKHDDKLIIIIDDENNYLAAFVSRKVYRKFLMNKTSN